MPRTTEKFQLDESLWNRYREEHASAFLNTTTRYYSRYYRETPGRYVKTRDVYAGDTLIGSNERTNTQTTYNNYVTTDHLNGTNLVTWQSVRFFTVSEVQLCRHITTGDKVQTHLTGMPLVDEMVNFLGCV